MPGFEGTFLGDSSKLHPDTRLECKVCHYIYDPAKGDVDQNIEPGTPFSELPEYWNHGRCLFHRLTRSKACREKIS